VEGDRPFVSGSITLSYSTGELGHPLRSSSGSAFGSVDFWWME
jgi:hypothetical protein